MNDVNVERAQELVDAIPPEAWEAFTAHYRSLNEHYLVQDFVDCVHGLFFDKLTSVCIRARAEVRS